MIEAGRGWVHLYRNFTLTLRQLGVINIVGGSGNKIVGWNIVTDIPAVVVSKSPGTTIEHVTVTRPKKKRTGPSTA